MQARILPILASIVSHHTSNSSILVEGALDLLVSLVKPANAEQAQQMHAAVSSHIQALMLHSQDAGILQSCCQYLKSVTQAFVPSVMLLLLFCGQL